MARKRYYFDNLGLSKGSTGSLQYGDDGVLKWTPMWMKRSIVSVWNRINCKLHGHDPIGLALYEVAPGPPTCVNCCAVLPINGRYLTDDEIKEHDERVRQLWATWGTDSHDEKSK